MNIKPVHANHREATQAVAYLLDIPKEQLQGYVIVGIRLDCDYEILSNSVHPEGLAFLLADAAAQTMRHIADAIPVEKVT